MHGFGHEYGILGIGDAGVHENSVGAEFHCDGGVGGGADSCVYDQRHARDHFPQDADVGLVLNSHAAADGSAQGMIVAAPASIRRFAKTMSSDV